MPVRITALVDPDGGPSVRRLAWLASGGDGAPVGSAFLRLFARPGQDHLAELELHVHPAERRKGTGSLLLRAAVAAARDDGRRCVITQAEAGSAGEEFLAARDFRKVLTLTFTRLALADADIGALTGIIERPHPGYRLASWDGTVPDESADTFVRSRRAMDDMPMGSTDYGTVTWDLERMRDAAAAVERRGDLLHTTVAISEADGEIAGFTELVVPGDGKGDAQHYGTGVLPEHRGRGLGLWMKAASIREARERYPALGGLLADTAEGNAFMRHINDVLGYTPTHTTHEYQFDL
ncbi:GNAT family N-acetyltransferase [Streptomyces misionensis]|uniref:GNAT family N-acetyltransferase n=1 Tax=Streptomyces misionensis TaxID=67331 RepID=A0A5C6JH78_9ACTN|nr:GNAT family N-acetyltransferase [Streptomyces misionensis]TWV40370.1 GNAT family N-acetyltransferase [Streptomyces misionensis]